MFGKKKEEPAVKPNKVKIRMSINKSKNSIQESLDNYSVKLNGLIAQLTQLKKSHATASQINSHKDKIKRVLMAQQRMQNLYNRVEDMEMMINDAFVQNEALQSIGTVLDEANKVTVAPEIKNLLNAVKQFNNNFTDGFNKMNSVFGKIDDNMKQFEDATNVNIDQEIDDAINAKLHDYDVQTDMEAQSEDVDNIFTMN